MGNDDQLAVRNRGRDKHSPRDDLLFKLLIPLAAIVLLAGVLFSLDNWFVRPVRELARTPGVRLWGLPEKQPSLNYHPRIRHDVNGIDFRERVVTPELLRPARDFPNVWNIDLTSCTVSPEAMALLAEFPAVGQVRFRSCTIEPDVLTMLAEFPVLRCAHFEDCEMDVGHFVRHCADSRSLEMIHLKGIPIHPGNFKELKRWSQLRYLYFRKSKIHPDTVRDIAKKSLKVVGFSDMEITDEIIAAIVETYGFDSLILTKTNVTEAHIAKLCECRRLHYLNIGETNVPASAIRFLEQSKSLHRVYADYTPLGTGIDEMVLSNGCVIQGSDWIRK